MSGAALAPRRPWERRRIVLGVAGGIAAYKAVQLARDLTQIGAVVDVVLTRAAREFVGAISFEGVTGRPVHGDILAPGHALSHIRLAREADVVCVAPATADFLARAAAGQSDDLLTAILLATRAPILLCPAMNDRMWSHTQVQLNAAHLRDDLGYRLVGPAVGPLAFDEGEGPGRMEEPGAIIEHIGRALGSDARLGGRKIVVTAGPTREGVDAVRFLSNRSSGRMGYAIAAAAWRRGADVTLIAGPTGLSTATGVEFVRIETADDMERAVRASLRDSDALIMAAAVADFRPADQVAGKIKKQSAPRALDLEPAPDILQATRDARPDGIVVVGFALETDDLKRNAKGKLESKGLDFIVLNDATKPNSGFEVDTNEVVILHRDGSDEVMPVMSKDDVADVIIDRVADLIASRA
jgi:phosphopantothenoylcysteine decarboxylase/phosphopantothenate--cysteine ligase